MLMWPTYTNIGIDDRNQFDYFRTMPGGLDGVKQVIQDLKTKYNIRLLLPLQPLDTGTRREPTTIRQRWRLFRSKLVRMDSMVIRCKAFRKIFGAI